MLTVGGLLLGAVLTAPGAVGGVASAEPVDPVEQRVVATQADGLRDPFGPGSTAATGRRVPRPSDDLRDPFAALGPRQRVTAPASSTADLRSPFARAPESPRRTAKPEPAPRPATALAPAPRVDLRDPFGREHP